ncbi:MAG: hemerythrin domain-containing protein [Planctomycetaceae bacterium]|nr:hemerythrin domain-containing protein [Planctomycetaceae bacterium]
MNPLNRRKFMGLWAFSGTGLIIPDSIGAVDFLTATPATSNAVEADTMEVGAVEDLMREHGVLRRLLIVYGEFARALREGRQVGGFDQLNKAATLFRTFGQDYHEKALEEAYVFPSLKNSNTEAARTLDTLIAQHERAGQITEILLTATSGKQPENETTLAGLLESFVRMYNAHAAREDTVVFPAWKRAMNPRQAAEMSETFEDIERQRFGEGGFEKMVNDTADIERALGLYDLSQYTAQPIAIS